MKMRRFVMFFVVLLLAAGLAACTRSLPSDATPTPEAPEVEATSGPTSDVFEQINVNATQTAVAGQAQTPEAVPDEPTDAEPTDAGTEPGEAEPSTPEDTPEATSPPEVADTPVVVPTATPGIPTTYTIQKGEFPFCIARRFNVDVGELLGLNGLGVNSVVQPGASLKIPQTGKPFQGNRALRPHPATYTARAGDTIYSISCFYGDVDPSSIAIANGLTAPYILTPGQLLNIP